MLMQARQNDPAICAAIAPLLPAIYEAATNPAHWTEAFAQIVCLLGGNIALMIHDSGAIDKVDLDGFAKVHGLTPAEARILNLLLEHASLPPIVGELGVSINTVRSQLRAIREKTGARRQAELVKMLMSWPRRMG